MRKQLNGSLFENSTFSLLPYVLDPIFVGEKMAPSLLPDGAKKLTSGSEALLLFHLTTGDTEQI